VDLRLQFIGADEVPQRSFTLTEQDGQYTLPRVVAAATGTAWVEEAVIASCQVPDGAGALRAALLAAWDGNGPLGDGTRVESPQCRLDARHVTGPAEVRVTWAVTWYDTGFYDRYLNGGEAFLEEASVTIKFEPASVPAPAGDDWGHWGHVAVDFGTSYCTATLFEQQYLPKVRPLSTMQARQLRLELIDMLSRGPGRDLPGGARREFGEHVAEVAAALLPDTAGQSDDQLTVGLQRALNEESDTAPEYLYKVLLELEIRMPNTSSALRPALAAALNGLYSRAWRVPPLDRLRLFEVMLDVNEESVLESTATATVDPALTVRLGRSTDEDIAGSAQKYVYAGLKQRLGNPVPHEELAPGIDSDDLIREALRDLLSRCDDFVKTAAQNVGTGPIRTAVITFPTMATPAVRHKLAEMLREIRPGIVDNTLDEAIAAAMFTVLRDFGSDYETGLELLRSQSREMVPDQKWKQNLLVIDIGGGTTDIALLGLHLRDDTPEQVIRAAPESHGRFYELLPEVLGTTGRLQLGGELMSLRVFYWIKALLSDRLLKLPDGSFAAQLEALRLLDRRRQVQGEPGDSPLLSRIKNELPTEDSEPVTRAAFDILDRIVPTRSDPDFGRPGQAFWLLWRIADRAKLEFCGPRAPEEITLRSGDVRELLREAWSRLDSAPDVDGIPEETLAITLTRRDFEQLITRDIDEIMDLAYQLTLKRLSGTAETREPVDRIILTGQVSRAPLVRSQLLAFFGERDGVTWQPKSVGGVDGQFFKLATSIGACWTRVNKQFVPDREDQVTIDRMIAGRNQFRIDVNNLFFNLPCSFLRGEMPGGESDDANGILDIGAPMFQAYPDEDIAILRSREFGLTRTVSIFRDAQGPRPRWALFQWEVVNQQQNLGLDSDVWGHEIKAKLETTSNLDMFLLLSRGRPHHAVGGKAISVLTAAAAPARGWMRPRPAPAAATDAPDGLRFDPSRIVVNAYATDGMHEGTAIFPAAALDETFHVTDGNGQESVMPGAISSPLPRPPAGGHWTFHYQDENGELRGIGELTPPSRTGSLAIRYRASVDRRKPAGARRRGAVLAGELARRRPEQAGQRLPGPDGTYLRRVPGRAGSVQRNPLMEAIDRLLAAGDDSELARVARAGLVGLRAMLGDGTARYPDDPGLAATADLLRQLDKMLGDRNAVVEARQAATAPERLPADRRLADLIAAFAADPVVIRTIDDQSLTALSAVSDSAAGWLGFHLCLLRLAAPAAATWRGKAAPLTTDHGPVAWQLLPGDDDTVLVPPYITDLAGTTAPATGYRTSPSAPLDEEVVAAIGLGSPSVDSDPDAGTIARLSTLVLTLAELDDNLVLCLQAVLFKGSRRLDDELRKRYRAALLGRLREWARTPTRSTARLEALLEVDEALNSLTHRPPPPQASWWGQLRQQSRNAVSRSVDSLRNAGADVEVLPLGLKYRDIQDMTDHNDVGASSGGQPGDVLACLRLWARIEGRTLPGRVMYRA
jgi:hypothetical protein